jgi:hypothetical protein
MLFWQITLLPLHVFPPFVVISSWFVLLVLLVLFLLNLSKSWNRYLFLIALLAWNKRQTYTKHFYFNFCILNFDTCMTSDRISKKIKRIWKSKNSNIAHLEIYVKTRKNWILKHVKTTLNLIQSKMRVDHWRIFLTRRFSWRLSWDLILLPK